MAMELVAKVIERNLGGPWQQFFASLDPTPLASASIGQVHLATLKTGEQVALKVQYPDIQAVLERDFADMESILKGLFKLRPSVQENIGDAFYKIKESIAEECDYRRELQMQEHFAKLWEGHPLIHVPRVYKDFSASTLLCQEYVEGISFDDFLSTASQEEKHLAACILHDWFFDNIHIHLLFNSDPHPGNFIFHADGKISFLDFGSCQSYDKAFIEKIHRLYTVLEDNDRNGFESLMRDLGLVAKLSETDFDQLWELQAHSIGPILSRNEFQYTKDWFEKSQSLIQANKDSIRLPRDFVYFNRISFGVLSLFERLELRAPFGKWMLRYRDPAGGHPCSLQDLGIALPEHFTRSMRSVDKTSNQLPRVTVKDLPRAATDSNPPRTPVLGPDSTIPLRDFWRHQIFSDRMLVLEGALPKDLVGHYLGFEQVFEKRGNCLVRLDFNGESVQISSVLTGSPQELLRNCFPQDFPRLPVAGLGGILNPLGFELDHHWGEELRDGTIVINGLTGFWILDPIDLTFKNYFGSREFVNLGNSKDFQLFPSTGSSFDFVSNPEKTEFFALIGMTEEFRRPLRQLSEDVKSLQSDSLLEQDIVGLAIGSLGDYLDALKVFQSSMVSGGVVLTQQLTSSYESNLYLSIGDLNGDLRKVLLIDSNGVPIKLARLSHRMHICEHLILFTDDVAIGSETLECDSYGKQSLYWIDRRELRSDSKSVKVQTLLIPGSSALLPFLYQEGKVHLISHVGSGAPLFIQKEDLTISGKPIREDLIGTLLAIDTDPYYLVIDFEKGEVVNEKRIAEEAHHVTFEWTIKWENSMLLFGISYGRHPETMTERKRAWFEKIGTSWQPSSLVSYDPQTQKSRYYFCPKGSFIQSLVPIASEIPGASTNSLDKNSTYLIAQVFTFPHGESSGKEFWVFDALEIEKGPLCKLGHPRNFIGEMFHPLWLSELRPPVIQGTPLSKYIGKDIERLPEEVQNVFRKVLYKKFG